MAWNYKATLISLKADGEDELLQPSFREEKIAVLCNKRSLTRSEFYLASQADMRPTMILEIHTFEYSNQDYLEFEGIRYKIIKTYEKSSELLELTCSKSLGETEA